MVATPPNLPPQDVLLLDTNVLIIYARAGEPSRRLELQLGLQSGKAQGFVSVVTIGEALAFASKCHWGQARREALMALARSRLVAIDINQPEILAAYAEISHYSETCGKRMGQNDIWIGATAHVLDCELVTTDRDFDHLHGVKLRRRWVDPVSLKGEKR
jgi:predicted nucleic acid-binding protein